MGKLVVNGFRYRDLPAINPRVVPIEADLSRNDVKVLHKLCVGKTVAEFGSGGSTLLLARFARIVLSYEHDEEWIKLVYKAALKRRAQGVKMSRIVLQSVPEEGTPPKIPRVDVLFVDGKREFRYLWVEHAIKHHTARIIVLHDSRARKSPIAACTSLLTWPLTLRIDQVAYHYKASNHLVIWLRPSPVRYENWNKTEPVRRLPHLHKRHAK